MPTNESKAAAFDEIGSGIIVAMDELRRQASVLAAEPYLLEIATLLEQAKIMARIAAIQLRNGK